MRSFPYLNCGCPKPYSSLILIGVSIALLALAGCGAGEDKLDPKFQQAFDAQGKRGTATGSGSEDPNLRGQALPPGATPPPSNP